MFLNILQKIIYKIFWNIAIQIFLKLKFMMYKMYILNTFIDFLLKVCVYINIIMNLYLSNF